MDLDHLAAETTVEAGLVQQRPQHVQHLLAADWGVSEVDGAAGRLDLYPRPGRAAEQLRSFSVERRESLHLLARRRGKSAVADQQCSGDRDVLRELSGGAAAEDDHPVEHRHEAAQGVQGIRQRRGESGLRNDLGQGAVEVGYEQHFIWPNRGKC